MVNNYKETDGPGSRVEYSKKYYLWKYDAKQLWPNESPLLSH